MHMRTSTGRLMWNLRIKRYKNRKGSNLQQGISVDNADSMNEMIERMFSAVRQSMKDERDKIVNTIKADVNSSKQKALMKMQ
jgi:hypothetical protein